MRHSESKFQKCAPQAKRNIQIDPLESQRKRSRILAIQLESARLRDRKHGELAQAQRKRSIEQTFKQLGAFKLVFGCEKAVDDIVFESSKQSEAIPANKSKPRDCAANRDDAANTFVAFTLSSV